MNRITWLAVAVLLSIAVVEFSLLTTGSAVPVRAGSAPGHSSAAGLADARGAAATGALVNGVVATATSTPTPLPATATPTGAVPAAPTIPTAPAMDLGTATPWFPADPRNAGATTRTPIPTPPNPLLIATPAPGGAGAAVLVATGSIAGTVTNALGTPIAGANVYACCYAGSAVTAANGTYVISGLAPGSYVVPVFASGYAPTLYNGTYNFDLATRVTVTSGSTTSGINFALARGANITGTVTNALGTPIAGASLLACRPFITGYCGDATSAANGTYTIADVAPGSYGVRASASGYAPTYYNGTYDFSAATLVTATSGATTPNINFALALGGRIAGKVTNALGTPIAGSWVSANRDTCCGGGSAMSAADGTYTITSLLAGSYRMQASGPYCPAGASSPPCVDYVSQYYNGTSDYSAATLVTATSGVTTPNINFALVLGGHIAGTVTNALGTPIAGAQVSANSDACCGGGNATSAADGTYTITGLPTGSYRVQASGPYCPAGASSPPCVDYVSQYYNGASNYGSATLVPATSGVTTPGINFALGLGARISGTVTNALGTPIAGSWVSASRDTCCGGSGATSGADGTYTITGLFAGSYRVQASTPSCPGGATSPPCVDYVPQYFNGASDYNAATLVTATSGVTTPNINFALVLGGRIAGTVTNALGTPVAGEWVTANRDTCCGGGGAMSATDGTYTITGLPAGSYRVHAYGPYCLGGASSPPCVDYVSQYYNGASDYSAATLVTATSGVTTPNINFALVLGARISGTVTNALGTPIAGAGVSASRMGCCGSGSANTAADGTYTITGLPAGSYRVQAPGSYCPAGAISPPCVGYASKYYNDTYDYSSATPVATTSGNTTPGINFALSLGGTISGKVINALGTPVAGAWVTADRNHGAGGGGWATSAADGTYLLTSLAPGGDVVGASVSGCPPASPPSSPPPAGPPCTPYPIWFYSGTCEYLSATPVPVVSGGTVTNINITLRPANPDCFDHAVSIGGLPFSDARSTAGATTAPGELLPCGNMGATVWYEYTAPPSPAAPNTTSVDTVGSTFNTAVAVYSQGVSPPGILTLVGCKASGPGSLVSFTASPGMRYYFQIGGQLAATGQLVVNVSPDTDGDGYTDIQETRLGKNPAVYCNIMRADVDGDGAVSILDFVRVAQYFAQSIPPAPPRYNQDGDNKISVLDFVRMAQVYARHVSACP